MTKQFKKLLEKMEPLLEMLRTGSPSTRADLAGVPERGIYAFYEGGTPLYVGRSNSIKKRLLLHSRPSSRHNSATFAFILAKESACQVGIDITGKQRKEMESDPIFKGLYEQAKARVAAMEIRVVEVVDPIEQTIFEVFAAVSLATRYNNFDNH